jgi:thiol-disulfide isomerase/thioredoxin
MQTKWITICLMVALALVVSACSPRAEAAEPMEEPALAAPMDQETPDDMVMPEEDMGKPEMAGEAEMPEKPAETGAAMEMEDEDPAQPMVETPDWFKAELVNVSTGEPFRIADYQGKVVLVETMAMWCSNCLKQQQQVKALHDLLGERDDFISVGLDIDINEDAATLAKYVERNGFDWVYTVISAEIGREIGNLYGNQFLNPPSTPMLIIDSNGEAHPLPFGIKSAEKLLEALQPFLDDSM